MTTMCMLASAVWGGSSSSAASRGRVSHAIYEYYCDKCEREVTLTMSIREHEKGPIKCPKCGGKALRPLLSAFMSQTSKKS